MATINFFITPRSKDTKKEITIYVMVRDRHSKQVAKTDLKVQPDHWNKTTQSFRDKADLINRRQKVNRLDEIYNYLDTKIKSGEKIIDTWLKDIMTDFFKEEEIQSIKEFWPAFDWYEKKKEKTVSQSRLNKVRTTKRELQAFEKRFRRQLTFDLIDAVFEAEFKNYQQEGKKMPNTIGTYFNVIKNFMKETFEEGFHSNVKYMKFKVANEQTEQFALTKEEVSRLYDYPFEDDRLARYRDMFIVGVYTGARQQDWHKFTLNNIEEIAGEPTLKYQQEKTGKDVTIYAHPRLMETLKRYPDGLPMVSNQKLNDSLKMVFFEIELNRMVKVSTFGGIVQRPMYKEISSHVARRTCATILHDAKMPIKDIMMITGHSRPETLMKYVRPNETEHIIKAKNAWGD